MTSHTATAEQTVRVIFTCKRCGTIRAFDYFNSANLYRNTPGTTGFFKNQTIADEDEICPCGRRCKRSSVEGHYNPAHMCNSRCMGATSGVCECSCGGKNHGGRYLS